MPTNKMSGCWRQSTPISSGRRSRRPSSEDQRAAADPGRKTGRPRTMSWTCLIRVRCGLRTLSGGEHPRADRAQSMVSHVWAPQPPEAPHAAQERAGVRRRTDRGPRRQSACQPLVVPAHKLLANSSLRRARSSGAGHRSIRLRPGPVASRRSVPNCSIAPSCSSVPAAATGRDFMPRVRRSSAC